MPRITFRVPDDQYYEIRKFLITHKGYNLSSLVRRAINWYIGKEKYGMPEDYGLDEKTFEYIKSLVEFGYFTNVGEAVLFILRSVLVSGDLERILKKRIEEKEFTIK